MSVRPLAMLLLVLAASPGCFFSRSKSQTPVQAAAVRKIVIGRSTMDDVVKALGAPTDIIFSNREHDPLRVFAYEYTYTVTKNTGLTLIVVTFINSDTKRDHVLVFFDERGVVSGVGSSLDSDRASYKLPFGQ
jgi:outer membrane protein assembly factor BamE (lipoprotein component of BamABCDE complex)